MGTSGSRLKRSRDEIDGATRRIYTPHKND